MALTWKSAFGGIKKAVGAVLGSGGPQMGAIITPAVPAVHGGFGGATGGVNVLNGAGILGHLPFSLPELVQGNGGTGGNPALGALGNLVSTAEAIKEIWGGGKEYATAAANQAVAIATESMPGVIATPDGIAYTGSGNKGGGTFGNIGGTFTLGGGFGASSGGRPGVLDGLSDTEKLIGAGVLGWLLFGRRRGG